MGGRRSCIYHALPDVAREEALTGPVMERGLNLRTDSTVATLIILSSTPLQNMQVLVNQCLKHLLRGIPSVIIIHVVGTDKQLGSISAHIAEPVSGITRAAFALGFQRLTTLDVTNCIKDLFESGTITAGVCHEPINTSLASRIGHKAEEISIIDGVVLDKPINRARINLRKWVRADEPPEFRRVVPVVVKAGFVVAVF